MIATVFTNLSGGAYFAMLMVLTWVLVVLHLLLFRLWKKPAVTSDALVHGQESDTQETANLPTAPGTNSYPSISMEDMQSMQEEILNKLTEIKALIASSGSGQQQDYPRREPDISSVGRHNKDTIEEFRAYLKTYYPSDAENILEMFLSFSQHLANEPVLRDNVIRCAAALDFANLSERRSLELCSIASEALESFQIKLYCPKIGDKFDPESMSLRNQYSDSERVSKVLYFGITSSNREIQKAVVNVG